jgi:DNA-binding NarL/FixJ family response regulator
MVGMGVTYFLLLVNVRSLAHSLRPAPFDRGQLLPALTALARSEVVEAVDGLEAIELAARKSPDIVLMDISMPGLNGVDARRVMAIAPAAKVIMLSTHQDEQRVVQSIRAGASGYLMKDVAVAEVATAIDGVLRGEVFISASARRTVSRMLASNEAETDGSTRDLRRRRAGAICHPCRPGLR